MAKKTPNKTTQLNIRLTIDERNFINNQAKEKNLNVTQYIIKKVTEKQILSFVMFTKIYLKGLP